MTANLAQIQWKWNGWSGAPGYTSFYYDTIDPTALNVALDAQGVFFDTVASLMFSTCNISPPANFRILDGATGDLEGFVAAVTPPATKVGGGSTAGSAATGIVVNWLTTTPATSRLVVGRTFLVPMGVQAYQSDGTIVDSSRTGLQTAANVLVAATTPTMVVWRRPVGGAGGSVAPVTAARVSDKVAVLKSRRD